MQRVPHTMISIIVNGFAGGDCRSFASLWLWGGLLSGLANVLQCVIAKTALPKKRGGFKNLNFLCSG